VGVWKASFLVGVTMTVAGCSLAAPWGQYAIPYEEARARLEKADIVGFRNGRECGFLIHFIPTRPDAQSIGWLVTSNDRAILRFHVSLSPTESGVQATIFVQAAPNGGEMYDGEQSYDYPILMQPLRPALQELVDAAMEKRPFDWHRLPDPLSIGPNDTLSNCVNSAASLQRGVPWSMNDPPGMSHQDAVRLGLRTE
jgi:hypothetical protein